MICMQLTTVRQCRAPDSRSSTTPRVAGSETDRQTDRHAACTRPLLHVRSCDKLAAQSRHETDRRTDRRTDLSQRCLMSPPPSVNTTYTSTLRVFLTNVCTATMKCGVFLHTHTHAHTHTHTHTGRGHGGTRPPLPSRFLD